MKMIRKSYKHKLRLVISILAAIKSIFFSICPANGAVFTIQFEASEGSLGDGSFHSHLERVFAPDGTQISSNFVSDSTGNIQGQFIFDTAIMPTDNEPFAGAGDYSTVGGPSWSSGDLTASPASGLGTPSFVLSSDGNVGTSLDFRASGFGGGLLRVTDSAFFSPGPFGGTPSHLFYDLFVPGEFSRTLLTTQFVDGKEVPTTIDLTNIASHANVSVHQTLWTTNSDGTFTLIQGNWSAPLTGITIVGSNNIPEPGMLWLVGLGAIPLIGFRLTRAR